MFRHTDISIERDGRLYWVRFDSDGAAGLVAYVVERGGKRTDQTRTIWGRVYDGEPNARIAGIIAEAHERTRLATAISQACKVRDAIIAEASKRAPDYDTFIAAASNANTQYNRTVKRAYARLA